MVEESDITALINAELNRIRPPKGVGQNIVFKIKTTEGTEHTFTIDASGHLMKDVEVINGLVKISEIIDFDTKTVLNTETNQFEYHTTTNYRYTYIPAVSIVSMQFEFLGKVVENANPNTNPENQTDNNAENGG
ncbi:MAG: hypothetical protein J6Z01_15100 [Bacteroidales bacterium]|nr:hypothetical protein [Bacteroidales bacterium]